MVDADRVTRKLPSLFVDFATTKKKSWNSLLRYRYRYSRFKKNHPERYNALTNKIIENLTEIKKAVSS